MAMAAILYVMDDNLHVITLDKVYIAQILKQNLKWNKAI